MAALGVLLLSPPWWAAEGDDGRAEVEACLERSLPSQSSVQTVELLLADDRGEIERSRAKIYWKRFEDELISVNLCFSEPPRRAGMAALASQRREGKPEIFVYLPELRQTRRVATGGEADSLFSTDFSYEDFAFLQGVAVDENAKRLPDRDLDGRAVYVLESRVSIADEPTYERVLYFIERERCLPVGAEFYEPGGTLRKQFEVEAHSISEVGERFVPMVSTMHDRVRGTRTVVTVKEIETDVEIRDDFFQPGRLHFGGRKACR